MNKSRKIIIGIVCVLFLIVFAVYFGGVWFFSGHFFPNSYINGKNYSFRTAKASQEDIAARISAYKLVIQELDDEEEKLTAKDIGLKYVEDGAIDKLIAKQDKWKWLLSAASPKKYTMSAVTTYNEEKLRAAVENLNCLQNMTDPVDAHIDIKGGTYYVVPEVEGNKLDPEGVYELVKKSVEAGDGVISLVKNGCYQKPAVYGDDENLASQVEKLNKYVQTTIYYDFGDREEVVDGDRIRSWLVQGEDGNYILDEKAMADYVYQLAYKYDTFGGTRQFTTATGENITVSGGDYGYVIKQDATLAELKEAIQNGESGTREPVYLYKGICRDTNDIGITYVEINLSTQMMYMYKDGSLLVETPVVTGNPSKGNATPTGVYALDNKKSPAVLKGEDYASNVTYWMPFNKNVGIHDCGTWRTEFGGNIYLTNGSHGCVNTPFAAAETIYNNIEIGTPIIVY